MNEQQIADAIQAGVAAGVKEATDSKRAAPAEVRNGSNWLRDNAKVVSAVGGAIIVIGVLAAVFVMPRWEATAAHIDTKQRITDHETSLTPHKQAEAVAKEVKKGTEKRLKFLEHGFGQVKRMVVRAAAPSRRAAVQEIADEEDDDEEGAIP